jgi:hypothetical protein
LAIKETIMARGSKAAYTDKQKRQARHIEEGFEERGMSEEEAGKRAWKVVNKITHGGRKSGSGRGKEENKEPYEKGGTRGGEAAASRSATSRSAAAKKGAKTRAASQRKSTAGKKKGKSDKK